MNILSSFFNKKLYQNADEEISKARNNEYNECLLKNMEFPNVEKIHLFIDNDYSEEVLDELVADHPNKDKIIKIKFGKQALFCDFFKYALEKLNGKVVAICHSDIYFNKCDMRLINHFIIEKGDAFCLTRHESTKYKPLIDKKVPSHDCYIFKASLDKQIVEETKFKQNARGSDNLMVFFLQKFGCKTYNPCLQIQIIHNHKSDFREYYYKRINNTRRFKDYVWKTAYHCRINPDTMEVTNL